MQSAGASRYKGDTRFLMNYTIELVRDSYVSDDECWERLRRVYAVLWDSFDEEKDTAVPGNFGEKAGTAEGTPALKADVSPL
jgi:hypothetical protein